MNRRNVIKHLGLTVMSVVGVDNLLAKNRPQKKEPTFLIISGWQTVNIGDIAHTPGLLTLLQREFPKAKLYLWPRDIEKHGTEEMLKRHFPALNIIKGNYNAEDLSITPELAKVFDDCDMLLHGSGPHVMGQDKIEVWMKHTQKPFVICGVTEAAIDERLGRIAKGASFYLTRETKSLEVLRTYLGEKKKTDFFADATFNLQLQDEAKAKTFLKANGLADKEFICAVPRLRYTPYYKIYPEQKWSEERIKQIDDTNNQYKEQDHAKLRYVITQWV